jgi:RNA polymerase sigma-70 factor, ECF subfamily
LEFYQFDGPYLERLCSGDFRPQEHFVAYFSELIQLKLRSRLQSPQAIEDLRQETFARVFSVLRGPTGMRQPDRLGAFVNSTCNNVLLEHYRSSARNAPIDDEEDLKIPDTAMDVVSIIAHKQMEQKVREILDELPERDRRVLKEIFIEERDKDDVCKDFGVDRNYLRVLLHRAKQSFRSSYLQSMSASAGGVKE